jgi:ABC-type Mn2+/Zn2+ transport system ATPase subunit
MSRIQEYLLKPELSMDLSPGSTIEDEADVSPSVALENASFHWSNSDSHAIKSMTFKLNSSCRLMMVNGPVGSGKSTLLNCLLGILPLVKDGGKMEIKGSIAYVSQTV